MTEEQFLEDFPRLYHLASPSSWPSLQLEGLQSTRMLVSRFQVRPGEVIVRRSKKPAVTCRATDLLREHRNERYTLEHPVHGQATLRDQRPINLKKLRACLDDDMAVEDWIELLNAKVFFWPDIERMAKMRKAYAKESQLLLTIDSRKLLAIVGSRHIRLSKINSGQTYYDPARRGRRTFRSLVAQQRGQAVAEVTVDNEVSRITDSVVRAQILRVDGTREQVSQQPIHRVSAPRAVNN